MSLFVGREKQCKVRQQQVVVIKIHKVDKNKYRIFGKTAWWTMTYFGQCHVVGLYCTSNLSFLGKDCSPIDLQESSHSSLCIIVDHHIISTTLKVVDNNVDI